MPANVRERVDPTPRIFPEILKVDVEVWVTVRGFEIVKLAETVCTAAPFALDTLIFAVPEGS